MFKKIISLFLIIAIVISTVVVPVFAAFGGYENYDIYDRDAKDALNSYLESQFVVNVPVVDFVSGAWDAIDGCFQVTALGNARSLGILQQWCDRWNDRMNSDAYWGMVASYVLVTAFNPVPEAVVEFDSDLKVYRLKEKYSGLWLVNSAGYFPFYRPVNSDGITGSETIRTGQWVAKSNLDSQMKFWHMVSYTDLVNYQKQWLDEYSGCRIAVGDGEYQWLIRTDRVSGALFVLCDELGYPYFMPDDKKAAVTTPQDYYTDITNQYTDNSTNVNVMDDGNAVVGSVIELENSILNVGGQVQYIDKAIYDSSTKTYYVDAHDEYVFDVTLNQYVTNNYTYEIQYHIDHTSITYIGQTEEYDERYEMYFQLPDGRSSADLTAEDLEQLSTVFVDVVQYARSADDLSLRGLYHFDGNTEDSSYWSYCTAFDWASGASLTYMDEGTFNGSLYLDETEHDFTITLTSATDLSSDFTIQFRYYQSHTTAPVADSYIQLGSDVVLQFTGSQYLLGSGDALCNTSIGSWNEICIMKSSGTLYYYINGVCCGEVEDNRSHASTIAFYFGDQQQTYKKIDELRISKGAIYTAGENYTPTSVPHDTNLTLILPDGDIPIADEVMVFVPGQNNILDRYNVSDWTNEGALDNLTVVTGSRHNKTYFEPYNEFGLFYNSKYTSLSYDESVTSLSVSALDSTYLYKSSSSTTYVTYYDIYAHQAGLFLPLACMSVEQSGNSDPSTYNDVFCSNVDPGTYTLSVVMSDGSSSSISFTVNSSGIPVVNSVSNESALNLFLEYPLSYWAYSKNTSSYYFYRYYGITMVPNSVSTEVDIMYMELVEGTEPEFSVTYEQAVYSSGELKESPVLAVRTNRPISGYQIGGVRPSYPQRGLVYAMVENSRITSLQQYTGYAWEQVDGRIWTGERWVPYGSFDVFTLKDYHDIIGGSDPDYEYIYTETGFWAWFQRAWLNFMAKLDAIIELLGGDPSKLPGSDGPGDDANLTFWERIKQVFENALAGVVESLLELITKILDLVLGVVYDLLDFFFNLITDAVTDGIGGLLETLTDGSLIRFFQSQEPMLDADGNPVFDENGNPVMVTVFGLPSGVAAVFAFISATIMLLPSELYFALLFGIGVAFLMAVFKLIKS